MTDIGSEAAQVCIAAVVKAAATRSLAVSVAVVDAAGHLVALLRMDGAGFLTTEIAEAKAFTSAAWKKPTSTVAERARQTPEAFNAFIDIGRTKVVPGLGGLPLLVDGRSIGAIGVSGASAEEDEMLAGIGVEALPAS